MNTKFQLSIRLMVLLISCCGVVMGQPVRSPQSPDAVSSHTLLTIIRHEDERRWDDQLKTLLEDGEPRVRRRAALAAGRIGDDRAVPVLAEMLLNDRDNAVREMAAFSLGEIESPGGAYALVTVLKNPDARARARAIEALGKVTAAMVGPASAAKKAENDERLDLCQAAIVNALRYELQRKPQRDRLTVLLGLTAVLRIRPDGAGSLVTKFLDDPDPAIVATALNTMARLRLKDANERVQQLLGNNAPIVRANAARVLGAAEHKEAFEALLDRALHDNDLRVRVSAIRTLANLKDQGAVEPLLSKTATAGINEQLEIATVLGRLIPNSANEKATAWLRRLHDITKSEAVEVEVAFARVAPEAFLNARPNSKTRNQPTTWRQTSRRAQGLGVIKDVITGAASGSAGDKTLKAAQQELAEMLQRPNLPPLASSDVLQAYAGYKAADVDQYARRFLQSNDVVVRSTGAEVLGNQKPSPENSQALINALPRALRDKESNDAAMAIVGALGKQKTSAANDAIKTALDSSDHLIRRRAVALLKANDVGDFASRIGTVQTRNTALDYRRATARIGKHPTATMVTSHGSFTIEFSPDDAPLTVDNFLQLAKRGYFNGQTIPRVVPNFVVQAGDPRGDQNGGPGYEIRCEINEAMFERAAVGMALSGKDTGGSQWFVTHSAQPHLDGGYTVFGRVIRGMDVVDNIVRGDVIRRVVVNDR
jgi:cyclophilin family peptidyl-prolyl cis-trans isomerase/HEAT repeat protein